MPFFTVIVPTYDRPTLLAHALESVRAQTMPDFECLVIEDSPPVSSAVLPPDPRFRLIRHESNHGVAAARNTGLANAKGSYVTFLDDDDAFTPDRLAFVRPLANQDHVVICGRATMNGNATNFRGLQGRVHHSILDGYAPHLGQATVHRSAAPRFDERYMALEDVDWWFRLTQDLPVFSTRSVGYLQRPHDGERHGNGHEARSRCSRVLLEQYADYFDRHRRAHAFRLERLARLEAGLGRRASARRAAWHSAVTLPQPRNVLLAAKLSVPLPAKRGSYA